MSNFALYTLDIKDHAYERYLERVGTIERDDLRVWCSNHLQDQNIWVKTKDQCIQIDDVWFGYEIASAVLFLVTCLGRSHIDLPRARKWAYRNNDRLALEINRDSKVLL